MVMLVVDFGNYGRAGYGSIHAHGCKDVDDPETLRRKTGLVGDHVSPADMHTLADVVEGYVTTTGWDDEETSDPASVWAVMASCARQHIRQ